MAISLALDKELEALIAKCVAEKVRVNGKVISQQAFVRDILRTELKKIAAIIDGDK